MSIAKTLLVLHGLGADKRQAENAFAQNFPGRVLSADLPGHGEEPLGADPARFDRFAEWVIGFLDRHDAPSVAIAGISMGAGIAVNVALRQPDRVSALVLVRPAWLDRPNPANLKIIGDIGRWLESASATEASDRLKSDPFYSELVKTNPAAAMSILGTMTRENAVSHAPVLSQMVASAPFASLSELARFTGPALVIATPDDPLHPVEIAAAWAEAVPGAHLSVLPSRYRCPDEFQSALDTQLVGFFRTSNASTRRLQ